jgi:transglutaminase-like putative cysteine protease
MRKVILIFLVLTIAALPVKAGDKDYAVSRIPPELLKDANLIIRLEETFTEMQSLEKLFTRHHYVITILNEKGDKYAEMTEYYDRFNEIKSIDGVLYDAFGNKIKSLKNKDIQDQSGSSGMSLADDIRYKTHNFYYKVYPYTVEYTIESVRRETMFFPSWVPVWDELVSVEKSSFSMKVAADYLLRYKIFNYNSEAVIKEEAGKKIYSWEIVNFPAIKKEYASPGWTKITPSVLLAPSQFSIEDYKGNMTDWNELGKFQTTLNLGRDVLPPAIKQKVAELIKDAGSLEEKVRRLYNFLQANTRYISIQLGIGGWRPFDAQYVASKSYGDCKALSNYMHSLLKEAGIQSYYTLIRAGDDAEDIITDFPSRQFNHAIVCVPNGKDTIWLECTDQNRAAGYMGAFTGNRHALLITEEGGRLVATPRYGLNENVQSRHVHALLDEGATLHIKSNSIYKAMQQDELEMMINALSRDRVKEYLHDQLDFATYEISNFDYKEIKSSLPVIDESLDIIVSNYATITGKRLFITPNVMTRSYRKLTADTARKYDLEIGFAYKDVDSVEIELPKGYGPEAMPQDVSLDTKFGKYNCSVQLKDNKLLYYRTLEKYSGRFPAKDYAELVKFYDAIYKADRNKVVLVK